MKRFHFEKIVNPLLQGDENISFRDPTVLYHEHRFYMYYSYVRREEKNRFYWYVALSQSDDLIQWSAPKIVTERGMDLNYSSPGNVFRFNGKWKMSLQTLPTPEKFRKDPEHVFPSPDDPFHVTGDQNSRIWTLESDDLLTWGNPQLLKVKGPDVSREEMGRIIDAYIYQDIKKEKTWWCFSKQTGVSLSYSHDLTNWTFFKSFDCGENVCVLNQGDDYILVHAPHNGVGFKRSKNMIDWSDEGVITLDQKHWEWAQKRLTAGFILDMTHEKEIGRYLLFFHGSSHQWDKNRNKMGHCSIGMAWSKDLKNWEWPSASQSQPAIQNLKCLEEIR